MSTPVDWTTLAAALPGAPDVAQTATGFATDVPVVLLPVRVETRFDAVEVPMTTDLGTLLTAALATLHTTLRGLADRSYATTLTGTVARKKSFKQEVETPLYAAVEHDVLSAGTQLQAVRAALDQPLTTGGKTAAAALSALADSIRQDLTDAGAALAVLRSPYQRRQLTGLLAGFAATVEPVLQQVDDRSVPALLLTEALTVRPAAQVARALGRSPDGQPLRPGLVASARAVSDVRVVQGDGTAAQALGASRIISLDHAGIADTAAAVEAIRSGLASGTPPVDLLSAAASLRVLPGTTKADLLAAVDAAQGAEVDTLRAAVAAVPSDRADLDQAVPDHLRDVVFEVAPPTELEHRLQVRIYFEPLAVDTHEPELTDTEAAAAAAFWSESAAAGTDGTRNLGAWRALCVGRSTRRAAWIAQVTEPPDPAHTPGALAAADLQAQLDILAKRLGELGRLDPTTPAGARQLAAVEKAITVLTTGVSAAPALPAAAKAALRARLETLRSVAAKLAERGIAAAKEWAETFAMLQDRIDGLPDEPPARPVLPDTARRASTWTRAAASGVLPDRFAVVTLAGGKVTHVAQGSPVPPDLELSLNPSDTSAAGQFSLDPDGNLIVAESIRWLVDFDEAVAKGMAVSLPITQAEAVAGFDEVFVIGLAGGDPQAGADRIAAMLDAHHYTAAGLSLLPIGTATNNTEAQPAGHTSADDADIAFPIERGPSMTADSDSDGARLAAALGVHADHLAHISGADARDAANSLTATAALYEGTLGHAFEELAAGLIPLDGRERLRAFVTSAVSARGLLPALRVADEPYGVLTVTSLSRFQPHPLEALPANASDAEKAAQSLVDNVLLAFLQQLHADWSRLRVEAHVKHAHSPEVGTAGFDAQQHFLAMLGLQATSVSASYRFAVNVADRGGVRGRADLSLSFGIPKPGGSSGDSAARFGPFAMMERFARPLQLAYDLADTVLRGPADTGGGVSDTWKPTYDRLTSARAYGLRFLQGTKPMRGVIAGTGTGVAITALLNTAAADLTSLATQARQVSAAGVPLAEMLVRHALLAEARRAAVRILFRERLVDDASFSLVGQSSQYGWTTITASIPISSWGYLFADVAELNYRFGVTFPAGGFAAYLSTGTAMAQYLAGRGNNSLASNYPNHADHQGVIDDLIAHANAVATFGALPAATIEALVREHLDLCSYRLDAWLTGLAQRRLSAMRAARSTGAQLGAYGWVENLRPDETTPASAVLPPALAGRPGRPVIHDEHNQGFIQAPSPAHAVTAAILRSGYASQDNQGGLRNDMSINLSSNRVRGALALIDGVRSGNDLGALLGYRIERFLHEYYARPDTPRVTELDSLIAPLRRAFPTVAAVDPAADADPERERQVVDGLALVRTVLDWVDGQPGLLVGHHSLYEILSGGGRFPGYPWGLPATAVPTAGELDRIDGLARALDDLADAVDALADLTTSEAVHQIVRGNHPRAAAVLAAVAEGKAPPTSEVAQTPQSGLPVTHRVLLQFDPQRADPPASPPGWDALPTTPRSELDPTVNTWLAALLGDPAAIRVRVRPSPPAAGSGPIPEVSVADLGLQPLDLLAMLGPGFEDGVGELVAHVLDHRRPINIEPDQPGAPVSDAPDDYAIDPHRAPEWGPAIRSISDVSVLLEAAADLLGKARPASTVDYAAPESGAVPAATDDADAGTRTARLRQRTGDAAVTLARLLANDATLDEAVLGGDPHAFVVAHEDVHLRDDPELGRVLVNPDLFWTAREAWRAAVVGAAQFGVRTAPPRRYRTRAQVSKELIQAAETGFVELVGRSQAAASADDAATPAAGRLAAVATALLGEAAVAVPRIELDATRADVSASLSAHRATPAALDAWLEGASAVRESIRHLSEVLVLAEAMGAAVTTAQVAQLPHVDGEAWLGGALDDPAALSGRVSVVVYGADRIPAAGTTAAALVVDEWTEVVPYREQTTGVALHYDQPDATAPQCVLVAVPPVRDQPWQLADLIATLHDTLEIARNRTVELEHLGTDLYGQLLPLVVGELVPEAARSTSQAQEAPGARVILDFAQNNPGGH